MNDLTREEAMAWCIKNKCNFKKTIYPQPQGWMWIITSDRIFLASIDHDKTKDITLDDIRKHKKIK